jgi:hypothetical protein
MVVERPIMCRAFSCATVVGGGAITSLFRPAIRFRSRLTSGGGATIEFFDRSGAVRDDLSPSAGGGPGTDLKASKFATGALDTGNFKSGASTTFSTAELPRATRMVWLR